MENLNLTTSSQSSIPSYRQKSMTEEETKSSSKMDSIAADTEENLYDSMFGSISEGRGSVLIQKVPHLDYLRSINNRPSQPEDLIQSLYKAIKSNNIELCKHILMNFNPKTDNKLEDSNTLLHISANLNQIEICQALLDYGIDTNINSQNKHLETPLHISCKMGYLKLSQLLVRSGADINLKDSNGNTPLHLASASGNSQLVSWVLSRNPNIRIQNNLGLLAEQCGSPDIKKTFHKYLKRTLISSGPNLNNGVKTKLLKSKSSDCAQKIAPHHFIVLKELGKGSFGEVFLVCKQDTNQLFAMKVLQKNKILGQNLIKYALAERNVLSCMSHPFIVSLNFAFQTVDKLFLILDFCPGGDLGYHLSREKRFTEYRARIYICEIILALEELHKNNIIFRDLKPDNIVLDENGHALLTDFGLSKEKVYDNYQATSFCGSLAYLAPEVIRRQGHGKAVDWYLLGVVFYEMVVGRPPYFSMDKNELIKNIQRGKLRMPSSLSHEARELIIDVRLI
jgi:Protein kinase domain/Ankyrin repeats (3 copies)/Ankyrin repeat